MIADEHHDNVQKVGNACETLDSQGCGFPLFLFNFPAGSLGVSMEVVGWFVLFGGF